MSLDLPFDLLAEARTAAERIAPFVRRTYLDPCPSFSALTGAEVLCKLENLQPTGSFKVRGATNKLLSLSEAERARGIVTASSGNHGAATAFGLGRLGSKGVVYVPEVASASKIAAIRRLGAEVRIHGHDGGVTEVHARKTAAQEGVSFFSPYNDPQIIAGQATIGLELLEQAQEIAGDTGGDIDGGIDAVFVSVGGGGLIGGIAGVLKSLAPGIEIYGCSAENSKVMMESVKAGEILDLPSLPTLSDGTAGGVEPGSITFPLCRDLVDHHVAVSEAEIAQALRIFLEQHHMLIEGAAAVALAAMQKVRDRIVGKRAVAIICGANIGLDDLKTVLEDG